MMARTADSVYENLPEPDQLLAHSLFLRLVSLGEGTEDTRRRVPLSELPTDLAAIVPELVQARLLTVDEDTVEVAHEALIREWPRLRAWLDEDRDAVRVQRHMTATSQTWLEAERDAT